MLQGARTPTTMRPADSTPAVPARPVPATRSRPSAGVLPSLSSLDLASRSTSGRRVELRLDNVAHPLAASVGRPGTRFRVPTFADLKAVYTDKTMKIPEKVVQERVGQLLGRMAVEKRLKSADPVATIIGKIFPAPGVIDEAEFKAAVDVADQVVIYQSVLDADTTVKAADKPKLTTAIADAVTLIKKVEVDAAGLTAVFGSKDTTAAARYVKARKALDDLSADLDKHVTTDYNLDDPQVGLGGWANFGSKDVHLVKDVVQVVDVKETKATLIHEASHLSASTVDDHGYYKLNTGFESLPESTKVDNAAHYEELPRREMGISLFPGLVFTPGKTKSGAKLTWEDTIHRQASEFMRKSWDAAVDTHTFLRGVRKAHLAGDTKPFTTNKTLILEISKLMDLTIHEQDKAAMQVSALDVTLSESIARGISIVGDLTDSQAVVVPPGKFADQASKDWAARNLVVMAAVTKYGNLLKDPARDLWLLRWMVFHYRQLP